MAMCEPACGKGILQFGDQLWFPGLTHGKGAQAEAAISPAYVAV